MAQWIEVRARYDSMAGPLPSNYGSVQGLSPIFVSKFPLNSSLPSMASATPTSKASGSASAWSVPASISPTLSIPTTKPGRLSWRTPKAC